MFTKQTEIRYNKYYLKQNPFPYVGVPQVPITVFTNRKNELDLIGESLVGVLSGNSSSHTAIIGSYGNGKTATLLYVQSQLEEHESNSVLASYLSNPGETLLQFYSNFMYGLRINKLEGIVWSYLGYITNDSRIKAKIEKGTVLITEVLEKAKHALHEDTYYIDFTNALLKIILEETKFLSWRYLCGDNLAFEERRQLDVVSSINSDEKAIRAFMTIKSILDKIGIKRMCILIDELESIELLLVVKKQKILNGLRHLIDLNPNGLSFILACAPESWSSIIKDYHAFSERIFRQVELVPLSYDDMVDVIATYLMESRIFPDRSKGKAREKYRDSNNEHNYLYPFTKESIKEILIVAHGNMRKILMICNRSIDKGVKLDCPLLTPATLKKILPEIFAGGKNF